jgi:hypothetical protein
MPLKLPNRAPVAPARPIHRDPSRANPLYGYGYNPSWPSVLSVAHDEADGGALFVITDRPCAINGAGNVVPLSVAGLSVLSGAMILPIKFRFAMNGAVPLHAPWQWGTGACDLFDPITGHAPNAGAGDCADVPGPYVPPGPPAVVATNFGGNTVTLTFDRPVAVTGDPPDDAVTVNGMTASSASNADANTISLAMPGPVNAGDPWAITRQPAWVATAIAWPEGGVL